MKNTFDNIEKLVKIVTTALTPEELTYFHSFLVESEDNIWELENLYPCPDDEDIQQMIIDLHEAFNDGLWDDEDILRAMQLSYLLTQAPNAESAEQIIDVWLTTYWDSYQSEEDQQNIEHIKSIMREER